MKVLDYGAERKWQGLSALSVPLLPKPRTYRPRPFKPGRGLPQHDSWRHVRVDAPLLHRTDVNMRRTTRAPERSCSQQKLTSEDDYRY